MRSTAHRLMSFIYNIQHGQMCIHLLRSLNSPVVDLSAGPFLPFAEKLWWRHSALYTALLACVCVYTADRKVHSNHGHSKNKLFTPQHKNSVESTCSLSTMYSRSFDLISFSEVVKTGPVVGHNRHRTEWKRSFPSLHPVESCTRAENWKREQ